MGVKTYTKDDLKNILSQMVDYIDNTEEDINEQYFLEISNSGLFHDAIGKIKKISKQNDTTQIEVLEDY